MNTENNWKTITLVIGGVAGLLAGIAAAYLFIKKQEATGAPLKLTSQDGLKIGLGTLSLVKMISESGKK